MKNITSIESLKASLPNTPICLHGTDGLPDSLFQSCIAAGISKVNVNSWARDPYVTSLISGLKGRSLPDAIEEATEIFARECERFMDVLGSTGKAD